MLPDVITQNIGDVTFAFRADKPKAHDRTYAASCGRVKPRRWVGMYNRGSVVCEAVLVAASEMLLCVNLPEGGHFFNIPGPASSANLMMLCYHMAEQIAGTSIIPKVDNTNEPRIDHIVTWAEAQGFSVP